MDLKLTSQSAHQVNSGTLRPPQTRHRGAKPTSIRLDLTRCSRRVAVLNVQSETEDKVRKQSHLLKTLKLVLNNFKFIYGGNSGKTFEVVGIFRQSMDFAFRCGSSTVATLIMEKTVNCQDINSLDLHSSLKNHLLMTLSFLLTVNVEM